MRKYGICTFFSTVKELTKNFVIIWRWGFSKAAGNTSRDSSHFDGSFELHASSLLEKLTPKYDLPDFFFHVCGLYVSCFVIFFKT
jgi:hypothetical protein